MTLSLPVLTTRLAALALLLALLPPPDELDLSRALAGLSSPLAAERTRAERWLAVNLEPTEDSILLEAARNGDTEVRVRIARALGALDRNLELAVRFSAESDAELARIGEDALRDQLGRWQEGLDAPLALDAPDVGVLRRAMEELRAQWPNERYRLALDGTLEVVVDRLARLAELPVALAVDPFVQAASRRGRTGSEVVEGTWDEVLQLVAVAYGVNLEGAVVTNEEGESRPLFLCFRPRTDAPPVTAAELLSDWCRTLTGDSELAARAARALAGTGWPAALAWMERRFDRAGHRASLDGLLVAAGRGRVPLAFSRSDLFGELLRRADTSPDGSRRARLVRALAMVPPVALDGVELDVRVATGLAPLAPAARMGRLVILEGMASHDADVHAHLRALAGDSLEPAERLQLLRAWSASGAPRDLDLAGIESLFDAVADENEAEELVRLLVDSGQVPDAGWLSPDRAADLSSPARTALFEWRLRTGRDESAADLAVRLGRLGEGWPVDDEARRGHAELARVLGRWVRSGDLVRVSDWLEGLARRSEDEAFRLAVHRLVILAGATSPDHVLRDLACLRRMVPPDEDEVSVGDELVLGALAARRTPAVAGAARAALFRAFARALARFESTDPTGARAERVFAGFDRATRDLFARGEDFEVELLARELRDLVRRYSGHPLAGRLQPGRWPRGPSSLPVDLEQRERRLTPQ